MKSMESATFTERSACVSCGNVSLQELSSGQFDQGAVGRFIDEDPWGEHPAPFLRGQSWSYVGCRACGLAFHRRILSPEWNERRFSKWMSQEAIAAFEAPRKSPERAVRKGKSLTAHALQIEKITRGIRGSAPVRLLDFGCGYGEFLTVCTGFGFEAFGVDRSSARRDNGSFAKVFSEMEDVRHLAPFHALTLFEVLEHLDDPRELVIRLRELVALGGLLVLEVPDCSGVKDINSRSDYAKIHPLEHINGFTPETLKGFAGAIGFEPIATPIACVTADLKKIATTTAKRLFAPFMKPTTQQYFRKT